MAEQYDKEEMARRSLIYELAKLDTMCNAFLEALEWDQMKEKYGFKDEDWPNVARVVNASKALLNPESKGFQQLFDNPLTKLAIISQPFDVFKKTEEEKDDGK